jgi:putative nucleotidyltransferase with HDIG domain
MAVVRQPGIEPARPEDRRRICELFPELTEFRDRELAERVTDLLVWVWRDSGWDDLAAVPYLVEAPELNLVTHVRFVAQGALLLGDLCAKMLGWPVDRDLLLATALLHDASKPKEYQRTEAGYGKSEVGRKLTHGVYATAMALQAGLPFELVHLIHSHTPMAAVEPKRVEGWIVRAVDNAMAEGRLGMSIARYVQHYND